MTLTTALDIEYRKVVPAQYTEKRDGSPMACMTCGANLVKGQAFAASHGQRLALVLLSLRR